MTKLYLCGYTATPKEEQTQRTTMGTHAHVEWEYEESAEHIVGQLREKGGVIVGLETVKGCPSIYEFSFNDALMEGRKGKEEEKRDVDKHRNQEMAVDERGMAQEKGWNGSFLVLIVGNERFGIGEELLSLCDHIVRIPCRGHKNSLNVGVAYSICVFEVLRQLLSDNDLDKIKRQGNDNK